MKILKSIVFLFAPMMLALLISACEKEGQEHNCDETKISSFTEDESHKNGQDCMSCHFAEGSGEGCFTIAGSLYDKSKTSPLNHATIDFFSEPNGGGDLVLSLEVDKKGNFYTTEQIDVSGLYTAAKGPSGTTHHMLSSINTGSCNSCHGNTADKIWSE